MRILAFASVAAVVVALCACGSKLSSFSPDGGLDADTGVDGGSTGAGSGSTVSVNSASTGGTAASGGSTGSTSNGDTGASGGGDTGDAGVGASGGADGGGGTVSGDGGKAPATRRLPLPCTAPLPTGYCLQSDSGDYIGGGRNSSASGTASVMLQPGSAGMFSFRLLNATTGDDWDAEFAAPAGAVLRPGLFDPAQRYPFQEGAAAGLNIDGNGSGCNTLTGKFSIEEFATSPAGITRLSVTFEQHCEGATAALRGVVNYQATGTPDATPTPDRTISLTGKIFRVAYDPSANIVYGIDATNRRLAKIDLSSGTTTYANVVQVPNDACVDAKRGRLFVVNKGSTLITEYSTSDLKSVRDIAWAGTDWGPTDTHFKIACAPDKLYVVDGAWAPALFTVEGLDGANPIAIDHTAQAAGVGGLVVNSANTDLYYWYQYGWSAGSLDTSVRRLQTSDLANIDQSSMSVSDFGRDPLDAPVLLDESRSLVFVKNKVFDALNLTKVVYSLPSNYDTFDGAAENAYALDSVHGLLATKNYVYELSRYDIVVPTLVAAADQTFFDANGNLWFLSIADGSLKSQIVSH